MKYSEQTLQNWTAPLSQTEEQRAENTIKMIRNAINSCDELKMMDIDIFIQGSYANNTNVRSESDVDVCVMLRDTFHTDYAQGKGREDYGFKASDFTFQEYRNLVKKALQDKFRTEYVYDGNKSLKIDENTYHVKADVVPSFQLRNYYYENSLDPNKYIEGVWLQAKTGEIVKNYPKRHKANGIAKNNNTSYQYKKLVRIMKHIKNEMVEDKKTDGDKITSFLVECLVYHVPNNVIIGYGKYTKELWIDRREKSKSLAWSSIVLALGNIKEEVVDRPKALGDIRGVTYIYGMFYRFGLIDVPDEVKEKMGHPKNRKK